MSDENNGEQSYDKNEFDYFPWSEAQLADSILQATKEGLRDAKAAEATASEAADNSTDPKKASELRKIAEKHGRDAREAERIGDVMRQRREGVVGLKCFRFLLQRFALCIQSFLALVFSSIFILRK
jgi:hypothetical protein